MEHLRVFNPELVAVDRILDPSETGLSRPIRYQIEVDNGQILRIRYADAQYERRFVTQAYIDPANRFLSFSYKTRLMGDEDDVYGFLTPEGYHPDLRAGQFVTDILAAADAGVFGEVRGVRGKWYNIPGKSQNWQEYMQARQVPCDNSAACLTWTGRKLCSSGYVIHHVDEKTDLIDGSISEVHAWFVKPSSG